MGLSAQRWERRVNALYHAARELPASERRSYLDRQSAGDAWLVADVLALLERDAAGEAAPASNVASPPGASPDGSVSLVRTIGPYRVQRVLGAGVAGVVYLAEADDPGRRLAIKVMLDAALTPARRKRFARDTKVLARLEHPRIARIFDADVLPDGAPYFVMEYVEGVPLTAYCDAAGYSIRDRVRLFRDACDAVLYGHRQSVLHLDLKPSNVLVAAGVAARADGEGLKILDFGLAEQLGRLVGRSRKAAARRLMVPAYAAPEQLRGEPVGVHTDVYLLGVLLYELLTGQPPFQPTQWTPDELASLVTTQEPEPPSEWLRAAAPPTEPARAADRRQWKDLDALCLTAMHKDPEHRYASVEALIRDVDHFLYEEPLDVRPATFGYRAGKFVRRNRRRLVLATLAAAAAAAAAAGNAFQLWG